MDNTRLPDDMYDSEGCGGGNAASSTTGTASLTALVQRMLLRLDELDSRTSAIQQPPPQKPISATPADGLEGLTNPGLWNPRNDEWDRYLADEKKHATRDEYRHLLCYGVFTAAAHAALTDAVATLRAKNATAHDTADANDLLVSAIRTIATVYSRFFDTTAAEGSSNGVDGLLNALDDKRLEVSLQQAAKAQAAAQFKGSGSGGSGGGSGNIRIKEQERAEHADRATKERADKNKDKDKIKGKPQPGNPARKTTTPQTEEQS
eukprot:jgi/Tetstr1/425206/TSEL_015667.t1